MKTLIKPRLILAITLLCTALFTSCEQNDEKPNENTARPKLTRIEEDAENFVTFGYDENGSLNKFKFVRLFMSYEAHFNYNTAKKPTSGVYDGFDMNFVYQNGLLDKIEFTLIPERTTVDHYLKFNYTANRVSRIVKYVKDGANFEIESRRDFTYYANGDLKSEIRSYPFPFSDDYVQTERIEYEYDDKTNPLQLADEITYLLEQPRATHNIRKITSYGTGDVLEETRSYSLNYNNFGHPTTGVQLLTSPFHQNITTNVKYFYQ
jgi:hypothetical protein